MLSREKESHCNIKHRRNNTIALTYDIQNTSTKLVMLNLSNKNENRIREHSQHNEHSKDFRCCHCLSNTGPACACHHRDKDLSQHLRRNESCSKNTSNKQKYNKSDYNKSNNVAEKEAQWPSLTKAELITIERKSKKYQAHLLPDRLSEKDLMLLHSIPALSHPDFNLGQRRCLLSLAKIYTNVSPGPRYTTQRAVTSHSKLAPLSHKNTERKSRNKGVKNVKSSKQDNSKKRKNSLTTAVGLFQSEPSEISKDMKCSDSKDSQETFYMTDEVSENNLLRELLSSSNNDDCYANNENENEGNDSNIQSNETMALTAIGIEENQQRLYTESKSEKNESDIKCINDDSDEINEENIDEIDFSNLEMDLVLNDYVINILKQQANILQLQFSAISSETSLANQLLENEGLETNVEQVDYQEIPDNIVEHSSEIGHLLSSFQTNCDDPSLDYSDNKEEMSNKEETIKPINEISVESKTVSDTKRVSNQNPEHISQTANDKDDDCISSQQRNEISNDYVNSIKGEHISDVDSIESNALDKINPQIDKKNDNEFIDENPLRNLSEHLRQTISL